MDAHTQKRALKDPATKRVVEYEVSRVLLRHFDGDVSLLVRSLSGTFVDCLIALRAHAREAVLYSPPYREGFNGSVTVRGVENRLPLPIVERVGPIEDIESWVELRREDFDWLHPLFRGELYTRN